MQLIYPDTYISAISADEENGSFPDDNLLDNHPKNLWKGSSNDAILTLTIDSGANAISLHNTNAVTAVVTITDRVVATSYGQNPAGEGRLWAEYTAVDSEHTALITLTSAVGSTIEAGVVRAGILKTYNDPEPGMGEGLKNYSIINQLPSGPLYIKSKDVVRKFQINTTMLRDTEFYEFMYEIIQVIGPTPIPWRLVSDIPSTDALLLESGDNLLTEIGFNILIESTADNYKWIVFGRCPQMPTAKHIDPMLSNVSFPVLEVI